MTTEDIIEYYANLLILQYVGKEHAYDTILSVVTPIVMDQIPLQVQNAFNINPTIQTISFSSVPAAGDFTVLYNTVESDAIAFDATAQDVQNILNSLIGLNSVTVSGDTTSGFIVNFVTIVAPSLIQLSTNTTSVTISLSNNTAVGVQLDTLGKYVGVTRTGYAFGGSITLDDSDFLTLIQVAIFKTQAGSSLATIQNLINTYFKGEMLVFDHANMSMDYFISSSIGSLPLAELFITEGLLPKPMGVQLGSLIYAPTINNFFGFRTYALPAYNVSPANTYADYILTYPWLSYSNAVVP